MSSSIYDELDAAANIVGTRVIEWRHYRHQHPELPNREVRHREVVVYP